MSIKYYKNYDRKIEVIQDEINGLTGGTITLTNYYTKGEDDANISNAIGGLKDSVSTDGDTLKKLRSLITDIQTILTSDDINLDTLQKIVTYIKSNKTALDTLTTDKVNITDIIDDLTHTDINKPLSANMGKNLKGLIDGLTKANVGLSNVDNTSDVNKPISTLQQTALNGKGDMFKSLYDTDNDGKVDYAVQSDNATKVNNHTASATPSTTEKTDIIGMINENTVQLAAITSKQKIVDTSYSPGSKTLQSGDTNAGFFGFVPASSFITGSALATAIGMTAGTLQNDTTPWIKYMWKNKVCFTPLKTIRHSIAHDDIYNCGCVYGIDDEGTLPPAGRLGASLSISSVDNSINDVNMYFQGDKTPVTQYADTVGVVGDVITLKGWANNGNNGDATIVSITNDKIVVSGLTLVTEVGDNTKKIFNKAKAVPQNKTVTVGALNYAVSLFKGSNADIHTKDADAIGTNNEWNWIIGQLHEQAKLKNWVYPQFMDGSLGDFRVYLTDKDLCTHYQYGNGNLTWCREPCLNDNRPWLRVIRGYLGVSFLGYGYSWNVYSNSGLRPRLELSQTATL